MHPDHFRPYVPMQCPPKVLSRTNSVAAASAASLLLMVIDTKKSHARPHKAKGMVFVCNKSFLYDQFDGSGYLSRAE